MMKYRLGLDLGSTSIGWAVLRLNEIEVGKYEPAAIIRTGVRIFSDGRNPKDGSSLAVTRRAARAARRRRDRLLRRKESMLRQLVALGFFPADEEARQRLVDLNPYHLRAKGLDEALTPNEFGRALFHINQRRGFKSNRKTDKSDADGSVMKKAIADLKAKLDELGVRTVGEYLYQRMQKGQPTRARLRQFTVQQDNGRNKIEKSYDLYIDRGMVEYEFEQLWSAQEKFNPELYNATAKDRLKHILLYQRPLKPVDPGRCSFLPQQKRAAKALPIAQHARIYQFANHLRYLDANNQEVTLTLSQRNIVVSELLKSSKRTFDQLRKALNFPGTAKFSIEDAKTKDIQGDRTAGILSGKKYFGNQWFKFDAELQNQIVEKLLYEENEADLIKWLVAYTGVTTEEAEEISAAPLPDGYGSLSVMALQRILPELKKDVISYDKAVVNAGFESHSALATYHDGEIYPELPYYGRILARHIGFGTNNPEDIDEIRYGRINNPTVHIGLNQLRQVVNGLIKEYGHPTQIVIELARDLKLGVDERNRIKKEQAENQKNNERRRQEIAAIIGKTAEQVTRLDLQKMILWEELAESPQDRCCPYTGRHISATMLFSAEVEIEHILPFSRTLDDSLNNKTVAMAWANRAKGNATPFEAFAGQQIEGIHYADILNRTSRMKKEKRYRFAEGAYEKWLREDKDFLARALNDTRYFSRIAKEYISVICPQHTWAIPGQLTALLRTQLGLNAILDEIEEKKNRHDHRHHAVDACVIAITDRSMLQRFATENARTLGKQYSRLIQRIEPPWPTFREQVRRAVSAIWVSYKPDHSHEGAMHNDTAYGLLGDGKVHHHKVVDGRRTEVIEALNVIPMTCEKANKRHGMNADGSPKAYKGYKGDSNYCMEIFLNEKGKWQSDVVSTYDAYQIVRKQGLKQLRHKTLAQNGKPLVMRLMRNDLIKMEHNGGVGVYRICVISSKGDLTLALHNESNVDARNRDKDDSFSYTFKTAGSLQKSKARLITVSATGRLKDSGFKE